MYGENAIELIKELDRNRDTLPPYNTDLIKQTQQEITELVHEIQRHDQSSDESRTQGGVPYSQILKSTAVKRNLRCLLAYHYNRVRCLRTMRWEFGSILPADLKRSMSAAENQWFSKYSTNLAKYMRSIGENGLNLAVDLKPPKSTFIEVRCLVDYGRFELSDGSVLLLKRNSQHCLPRVECEELIRQGVFEHIVQ